MSNLTRQAAQEYFNRWRLVNEAEIAELRSTPMEVKLRQLASLMASVKALGWESSLGKDEEEVRARWIRLKMIYGRN